MAPIRNEMPYLKAWCKNVERYADQVVVVDTGSTDGSREYLDDRGYTVLRCQISAPYEWLEASVRNMALQQCRGDWIVWQDADELVGGDFLSNIGGLEGSHFPFIGFRWLEFWHSPNLIRAWWPWRPSGRSGGDWKRYYPVEWRWKMHRRLSHIDWRGEGNHARLCWCGMNVARLLTRYTQIPFFHYHFCSGIEKEGSNRRDEGSGSIRLVTYFGSHPTDLELYLCDMKWL